MIIKFDNTFIKIMKKWINDEFYFNNDLSNLHLVLNNLKECDKMFFSKIQQLGINDRNSIFINKFHSFIDNDTNNEFLNNYYEFIKIYIKPLFSNEEKLVIQKTPNLRLSFPNLTAIGLKIDDPKNIVGLHKDSNFGHHCEEINFIIPITKMYDTNSIYYEPTINSNLSYDKYLNLKLNTDEILMEIFNQKLHYNKINDTDKTRISFDFRVIPYSKYMENLQYFTNTKFDLGKYYIVV